MHPFSVCVKRFSTGQLKDAYLRLWLSCTGKLTKYFLPKTKAPGVYARGFETKQPSLDGCLGLDHPPKVGQLFRLAGHVAQVLAVAGTLIANVGLVPNSA